MDWWVYLGIVAAIIGILSAIDHWLRPLFRPLISRLFRKNNKPPPPSLKVKNNLPLDPKSGGEEIPINIKIPAHTQDIKRVKISISVDYVNGLPDADQQIWKVFSQARKIKNNREYERAISLFEKCIKLSTFPEHINAIYIQIADCYYRLFQYDQSIIYYKKAEDLATETKDKEGLITALIDIGSLYLMIGKADEALKCLSDVKNRGIIENKKIEAILFINLGAVYEIKGELENALNNYNYALELIKIIGDNELEGHVLYHIGKFYFGKQEIKRALEYDLKALNIYREIGSREYEVIVLDVIGLNYFILKEHGKALDYYESALDISRKIGHREKEARILDNIGLLYMLKKDDKKATEYLGQSQTIEMDFMDREAQSRHLIFGAIYYGMMGDSKKATEYFERSRDLEI